MVDLEGKRVFVSGATGLAGSGIIRALISRPEDFHIIASRRRADGPIYSDPRLEYVTADLLKKHECLRASEGCNMAIMAAANTGGAAASRDNPQAQVTDNVIIDAHMLEAFHANNVSRVVYVSTASAYQPFEGFIREDELDWNIDPHDAHLGVGWVKRYGEKACWFWHKKTGREFAILRLANVFGPFARFDPAVSNFIPAIARKAVDQMDPFEVWGSPDVTRDVIYADDFGRAAVAALTMPQLDFETFNIGSGVKTTVEEVVGWTIKAACFSPSKIQFGESSTESLKIRALNIDKAEKRLGWVPEIGAQEGVRRTVEWWMANRNTWKR